MSDTVTIELTVEQIKALRPLIADWSKWCECNEPVMFAGQVITDSNGFFHSVKFGIIPHEQAMKITEIRGFVTKLEFVEKDSDGNRELDGRLWEEFPR